MSDWSELKRLAEAAGDPDRAIDENDYGDEIWFGGYGCGMIEVGKWINGGQKKDSEKWAAIKADAEFIAVATPLVVLTLINENTSLKADNNALLEALEGMMQVYGGVKWDTGAVEIELQDLAKAAIENARKTAAK